MRRLDALVLAGLVVLALALRWPVAGQALYGDELSTYWLMTRHGLLDGLAILRDRMEITPPLSFVLAWVATLPGDGARLLRAPALLAVLLLVPAVYALGRLTVGRAAGLLAAAFVALSPFAIFYGTEARAYGPLTLFVVVAAIAALRATATRRARWWVLLAVATAACALTHYTTLYVLLVLYAWLVLADRRNVVPAVLAGLGALVLFAPWALTGLQSDLDSPDSAIASALTVFTPTAVARETAHWVIGFPFDAIDLDVVPGVPAVIALAVAVLLGATGVLTRRRRPAAPVVLLVALAAATFAGTLLSSLLGNHQLYVRNLSASFGPFCLVLAALLLTPGPRVRIAAAGLAVAAFAVGAATMLDPRNGRPPYGPIGRIVDAEARPADVVIDGTGAGFSTPGPLTPLDSVVDPDLRTVRLGVPQERDRQFRDAPPPRSTPEVVRAAIRLAGADGRILVVSSGGPAPLLDAYERGLRQAGLPAAWRVVRREREPGTIGGVLLLVFER